MKKKSLVSMIVALGLTATIMVGATLAYLTDVTDKVTNTFTIGKVKIDLTEPDWYEEDAKDLEPGAEITKNPIVTNKNNDAYVAVTVDGMTKMAAAGFSAEVNVKDKDGNTAWVLVDKNGKPVENWDGKLVDGIYAYNKTMTKGEKSVALFDTVSFADKGIYNKNYTINEVAVDEKDKSQGTYFTIDGVKDEDGVKDKTFGTKEDAEKYIATMESELTYSFDLDVKAYAIQTTKFELTKDGVYTWVAEFGLK